MTQQPYPSSQPEPGPQPAEQPWGQQPPPGPQPQAQQPYGQPHGPQPPPQYGALPPGAPGPYAVPGQPVPMTVAEARQSAMLINISGILLGFLGPLVGMLVWGPRDAFVRHHAVQALNYQLMLLIAVVVTIALSFFFVGLLLLPLLMIGAYVFPIIAAVKASNGEWYQYPVTIPFVR